MKRSWLAGVLAAMTLVLTVPTAASARVNVVGMSGLECCVGLGLRLSISIDGASIRGALVLPSPETLVRVNGSSGGAELFGVSLGALDLVRWGVPVVRAVADATVSGLGKRVVEEARN